MSNLDPQRELMKSKRLVVTALHANSVEAVAYPESDSRNEFSAEDVIDIPMLTVGIEYPFGPGAGLSVDARRMQLPVAGACCLTVDRAMSQTLRRTCIDGRRDCYLPGGWYTAFSRTRSHEDILFVCREAKPTVNNAALPRFLKAFDCLR